MMKTKIDKISCILLAIIIILLSLTVILNKSDNKPTKLEQMVMQTLPAVVHIKCDAGWQGSGVIISKDGIILTASHVVGDGGNSFIVTLTDGRKFITQKSCVVRKFDVGYLKLEALEPNFPTVEIGDANSLRLGTQLFAIGSQFGEQGFNSITYGILSGKKRSVETMDGWSILFQSDVGANPGSSGGPVFNFNGELVGIVVGGPTRIYAGVIFCVPSNVFVKYLDAARSVFVMQDIKDTMEKKETEELENSQITIVLPLD